MGSEQKRLMLALILSGLVIFIWQLYFVPQVEVTPSELRHADQIAESSSPAQLDARDDSSVDVFIDDVDDSVSLQEFSLSSQGHFFSFLNNLTITNITNPDSVFDFKSIAGGELPFQIQLLRDTGPEDLYFDFDLVSTNKLQGQDERFGIIIEALILENGMLDFALRANRPYRYRFVFDSWSDEVVQNQRREFIYLANDVERIRVGNAKQSESTIRWFGLDYNYHLFAFVLNNPAPALYESTVDGKFILDFVRPTNELLGDLVFTKKTYDTLTDLGHQLHLAVDFGFIGVIAVPMLRSLQWFYNFIPNYGVAIILLTIAIRFILFPLSYSSFKSMKKMQKLQPQIQKLKEKYKDDPQRQQKEFMELFKKSGANPLGGCLPLLLQMPIFFAFYRVLYSSVELVNAPFIWWITDLSVKDPYYVLPFLMAAFMFLQQKLMPTATMDPTQRKIMLFLPVIFGFIMKDFPAGLNLYIAVSTLFGILQQLAVYKMIDD